jgi:hypothetical protein
MLEFEKSVFVGLGRISNNRIEAAHVAALFWRGVACRHRQYAQKQLSRAGWLRRIATDSRSCPRTGLPLTVNALALMFGHSIDKAILERRSNHGPCTQ